MTNDIIVLIPGIGGSRLERDGKAIYDLSVGALSSLIWNWVGGDLAYTGGSGKPDDGVVATDLFNNQLIPGYFGVDDYDGLSATLKAAVKNPAQQFFKFPYDWRASNRWAAEGLDAFIHPKLHDWRNGAGGNDAKLWLVCHSMGGLVARYFLEHLGGAAITRRLITLGTPHRGAPKALNSLVNGMGLGPLDFSKVIRSFASTYELLPQYPVVRVGEGNDAPMARVADLCGLAGVLPVPNAAGAQTPAPTGLSPLPHIDPARLRDALAFHAAIRQPVIQRMNNGEQSPYEISCIFNRRQTTPQSARWSCDALEMSDDSPIPTPTGQDAALHRGDGTVPGPSAVPIEWQDTAKAVAVNEKHVAMPSAAVVTDILHNYASAILTKEYMSGTALDGTIGLTVPPLVLVGQAFEIVADVIKAAHLTVSLAPVESGITSQSERVYVAEGSSARIEFMLLKHGTYIVTAKSVDPKRPMIKDWLVAIAAE
jgi:pimeloyl-ACP methyl ester carboxylesterase